MLEQVVKPLSSGSILPWLTASRIVTTNSLSQLATPSSISSDQSLTLSGTATATVAGLITAQSGLSVSSNAAVSGTGTVTGLLTASSALTVNSTATFNGTTTVIDGNFRIIGSSDTTKTMRFEVDAQTAADDLTINSGAQTDDRTLSVPVLTGSDTIATLAVANNFSAINTFSNTTASTSKDTGGVIMEGGLGVEGDIFGGVSINAAAGLFSGDYSSSAGMTFKSADGSAASLAFRTATNNAIRWQLLKTGTTHTLNWSAFDSSGALIDTPISCLNAANGELTFARPTTVTDILKISGSANLPAACGGALFIAGNQSGAVSGSIYIGDGTGWSFKIRSRTGSADTDRITITDGGIVTLTSTSVSSITTAGGISVASGVLITSTAAFTNGAGANTGTLTNSPATGNPTKWIPINDNGTTRYIPAW